jgi:hypothetical protein
MISANIYDNILESSLDIQSFLLLKNDIKPVIRIGLPPDIEYFKHFITKKLGLEMIIIKNTELYDQKLDSPVFNAYISKSSVLADQAAKAEIMGDRIKLGILLGYPKCCVEYFCRTLGKEKTISSFINTKSKPSFYCNNLFVYDSKLESENSISFFNSNRTKLDQYSHLFLIRHVPCSYDCKESINLGRKTLSFLKKEKPEIASNIINALKRPVIYFDYFRWAVLDGFVKYNTIFYKKVLPFESFLERNILEKIMEGNSIVVTEKRITVFKNQSEIYSINKKDKFDGFILDFS